MLEFINFPARCSKDRSLVKVTLKIKLSVYAMKMYGREKLQLHTLLLVVSQPVSLGVEPLVWLMTRYFIICMTCTVALSPDEKVGQSLSCV
jgi:hypothetical protein